MKKLLIFFLVCITACSKKPDGDFEDGLKRNIQKAKSPEQKITWLSRLAWYYMDIDQTRSDSTMSEAYTIAEDTKNNGISALACLFDAQRHLALYDRKREMQAVYALAQKAYDLALSGNYKEYMAYSLLYKAHSSRYLGNLQEAGGYLVQADDIVKDSGSDSLKIEFYYLKSQVSQDKRDLNDALENALQVHRIAEQSKNDNLKAMASLRLGVIYQDIDSIAAKEYYKNLDSLSRRVGDVEQLIIADLRLGRLYSGEKQLMQQGSKYLHNAMNLAQQVNHQNLIIQSHLALVRFYLTTGQNDSAVSYLNKNIPLFYSYYSKNMQVARYYYQYSALCYDLGLNQRSIGNEESAYNSFRLALTYLWRSDSIYYPDAVASTQSDISFYQGATNYYLYSLKKRSLTTAQEASACFNNAIFYFNRTKDLAKQISNPQFMRNTFLWMEYLYRDSAEYYARNAPYNFYPNPVPTADYYKLSYSSRCSYDSCDSVFRGLTSQKELARIVKDDKEKTEKINLIIQRQKNSLKLIGITAALAVIFLLLILAGFLRVSEFWIRVLGVFAFLTLFEFIILIIDRQLHEFTHGEVVSLLLIKVAIAAILSPIHHFLEKRVIRSLTRRKLLREDARRLKDMAEGTKEERLS